MRKILVVGGGVYQVPLIKRIVELGYAALCVDCNKNAPGFSVATDYKQIDVLDKEACLRYARENGVDAVMTYGATLPLPTVSYIAEKLNLPALPAETAELSKSKYKIKKRLSEYGCNIFGDFFEVTTMDEAKRHKYTFPCVIKPSDGSGSKGVSLVLNDSELDTALKSAFSAARFGSIYKEDFIAGEEYTVEAFVYRGKPYVYSVIKTTFNRTEDNEIHYGHRTPSGLSADDETKIKEEVCKAISALNITMSSVNFDIILSKDDGKPYIIDCGIRIGQNLIASHIVPFSRGVDIIDNTVKLALGEEIAPEPKFEKCIATRLLIYGSGVITEIKDMSDLIGSNGILDVVMRKKVGDFQNEYKEKSDTCGWVITEGKTPTEAESRAEKARELLKKYIIIS